MAPYGVDVFIRHIGQILSRQKILVFAATLFADPIFYLVVQFFKWLVFQTGCGSSLSLKRPLINL